MGYYTRFDISNNEPEVIEAIGEESGYGDSIMDCEIKWYSCSEDMKAVSRKFPDKVLEVSGEGEETGDIWTAYYKNGKEQYEKATIVVGKYDENKLK